MPNSEKAILLDLDGILFHLVDHYGEYGVSARTEDEIQIVEGLGSSLTKLKDLSFHIIGHTNQPDIARAKITGEFLGKKHSRLQQTYPQIEQIYICPHTETDLCNCRKPKPGLLRQAEKDFKLDLGLSWIIGDSRGDIEAGEMVHAKTILVQTKYNCGTPAIEVATAVAKNTKGALWLITALSEGTSNKQGV